MNWLEPVLALRDRWLADPRFQRRALAFPLTRFIARRRARALFDLCAGFVYSQVLLACVRLRVLEQLRDGPLPVARLRESLQLPDDAADRLLTAAAALRLLERRSGQRYALGPLGAALAGNPGILALVEHHGLFYADLQDPVALLRGQSASTHLAGHWPYAGTARPAELGADAVRDYTALMSTSQQMVAPELLAAYPLDRHRAVLDLGGGDGRLLEAIALRHPHLALTLFELPAVAGLARERLAAAGLGERVRVVPGDFLRGPLPAGADLVTLVRVLHDHDDDTALTILAAARAAVSGDGVVLVAEPMAGTPGAEPVGEAYFAFYLMAMKPGGRAGRARSSGELAALGRRAGFRHFRLLDNPAPLVVRLAVLTP